MGSIVRDAAASALAVVRRAPWIHAPIHWIAVHLAKTRWGARFIRDVLEPPHGTPTTYQEWLAQHDVLHPHDRAEIATHIARCPRRRDLGGMPAKGRRNDGRATMRGASSSIRPGSRIATTPRRATRCGRCDR